MYKAMCRPIFLGNSLQLLCHFGIMESELNRSVSEKMSMRAEMTFLKVNGKSEMELNGRSQIKHFLTRSNNG
jgi:hypothetical protein